jgi:hypothetical protein
MSALVWLLLLYSAATVTLLTVTEGIPVILGMLYNILCFMALACHAKTSLTDPGSVPLAAIPSERQRLMKDSHSMCGQCQTFKPPMSHHCRICNRCISRMDHHCPWMNNCVGAGNLSKYKTVDGMEDEWNGRQGTHRQEPESGAFFRCFFSLLTVTLFLTATPTPSYLLRRTLSSFSLVHLDLCCLFLGIVRLELLFLRRRKLYLPPHYRTLGPSHDSSLRRCLPLYIEHVDECLLWVDDGDWYD